MTTVENLKLCILASSELASSCVSGCFMKPRDEMEVDSDLDQELVQQFSSMGTTDKEVLISEFQKLLGNQLNPAGCAFFLDMNNWNLQAAICSYYDFESPKDKVPSMSLVQDITIGEGESVPPNTRFIKTWRIRNSGDEKWPCGVCLRFTQGYLLGADESIPVEDLEPGHMTDVSVAMVSPPSCGIFQGQWRMMTRTGQYFGEIIWVILEVKEGGMLGLTQQLSNLGSDFVPEQQRLANGSSRNPFGTSPLQSPANSNTQLGNSPTILSSGTMATEDNQSPSSPIRAPIFEVSHSDTSYLLQQHQIQFGSSANHQHNPHGHKDSLS
ncbi:protein ILRUN-like [Ptychodera flava]|uniref:protein ILRUN-like n=1 Tax=Ptychodera flava TaxID=63121 RepID=UPI00396A65E4